MSIMSSQEKNVMGEKDARFVTHKKKKGYISKTYIHIYQLVIILAKFLIWKYSNVKIISIPIQYHPVCFSYLDL